MATATTNDETTLPRQASNPGGRRRNPMLSSGLTVLDVACAAAETSREATDKAVGITLGLQSP